MDLDELRSVRRTERQKDSLQHLRDSFYEDVAAYIEERKAERRRAAEAADDPFGDPEVGQLSDEISTAEEVVEAIYERRVGKVVKLASFAAADMSADKSGLTAEERDLFDDLVDRIKRNRQTVLDTLAGEGGSDSTADVGIGAGADSGAGTEAGSHSGNGSNASTESAVAADRSDTASTDAASEPADEPAAPDDVLAAAMGGEADGESAADAGVESNAGAAESAPGAAESTSADEQPAAPPEAAPERKSREAPVIDGAETDGGAPGAVPGTDADASEDSGTAPSEPREAMAVAGADVGGESHASDASADTDGAGRRTGTPDGDVGAPDTTDRVTLRVTEDVGRIYGVDEREYDLAAEDVVTLPATNAAPLLDRDAAERLE